jgi:hypothetical protein
VIADGVDQPLFCAAVKDILRHEDGWIRDLVAPRTNG